MSISEKNIYLLRHAHAASSKDGSDKNRPLSEQGKQDAMALGRYMKAQSFTPEFILCSDALRTRQTLECVQKTHDGLLSAKIEFSTRLYSGTTGDYFTLLQGFDDRYNSALVIAHNPSIYDLVRYLCGYGTEQAQNRLLEGYPPATLSEVRLKTLSWQDLQADENMLNSLISPIDYNAPERPTRWM